MEPSVREIGDLSIIRDNKHIKIKDLSNKDKIRMIGQLLMERDVVIKSYNNLKLKTEWNG